MHPPNNVSLILRTREVATLLGISRPTAYQMIRDGRLPVVRIGAKLHVPRQALMHWLETATTQPQSAASTEA